MRRLRYFIPMLNLVKPLALVNERHLFEAGFEKHMVSAHNGKPSLRSDKIAVSPNTSVKSRIPDYNRNPQKQENLYEPDKIIAADEGRDVLRFVQSFVNVKRNTDSVLLNTALKAYADEVELERLHSVINFQEINTVPRLNDYYRAVNKLLPDAGVFIGKVHTYQVRSMEKMQKHGRVLGKFLTRKDFILNRVMPKVYPLNIVHRMIKGDKYHVYSKAEVLGRLVYCGFEIMACERIGPYTYFAGMKTGEPMKTEKRPSYFPLVKMPRVGKHGKMIHVYKVRTMHPYSEFLQDFVIKLNGYNDKGKPADDFRLTSWGRWMRRLWIDEMPQLINLLKGEMKLVGVRPLSKVRFNALPPDVQEERVKHKPGCFPPYVALCMPDENQNIEAEIIYMKEKNKRPAGTDTRYLLRSIYNILTNKIRSA